MYQQRGFTLIELLVVVLIIGILSAVALPQYQKAVLKSRYMQLMTAGDTIQRAEEAYYMANGQYTNDLEALDIQFPPSTDVDFSPDVRPSGHAALNVRALKYKIGHIVYFNNHLTGGMRECRAYDNDSLANQVCQGMTNKKTGISANNYIAYRFD